MPPFLIAAGNQAAYRNGIFRGRWEFQLGNIQNHVYFFPNNMKLHVSTEHHIDLPIIRHIF